ncbi:MAG: NAD-glutamate dehydrogenase [Dermatophilus congolensis]|nr:NAD-glutamate dehydrogenase [Dermatophilus congolensis]
MPDEDAQRRAHLEAASAGVPGATSESQFLAYFYRHVATEELLHIEPEDLAGAALSTRALAARIDDGASVRVFTPTLERDGWASGHTVIEVVTADVSFLVDSVLELLDRIDRRVHFIAHPQLMVRRGSDGELLSVTEATVETEGHESHDARAESWMHIEIDRESDLPDLEEIERSVRSVLRDVHAAVADFEPMRDRALALRDALENDPPASLDPESIEQARQLLDWICGDQYIFIGAADYMLDPVDGVDYLARVPGSGLGILDDGSSEGDEPTLRTLITDAVAAKAREKVAYVFTKANSISTVHRSARLDYVGIKKVDEAGEVVGEHRFVGLFTARAYMWSVTMLPFVAEKVRRITDAAGYLPHSHLGNDLIGVLESYPRDELFHDSVSHLTQVATDVVHLREKRSTRLFMRADVYGRFVTCLVYLPRDRYNTEVRLRMQDLLRAALGGKEVEYRTRVSESSLAQLYFIVHTADPEKARSVDADELEARIIDATRTWDEGLSEAAVQHFGEEAAATLLSRYRKAFAGAYKEEVSPRVAVTDIATLEALEPGAAVRPVLYHMPGAAPEERRVKLFSRSAISLSDVLPVFTDLGVRVTDERPHMVRRADGATFHIYDFGLRATSGALWPETTGETTLPFEEAFRAVWEGAAESDRFNALVLQAGLSWRQVVILRAIWSYLRQAGTTYSQAYAEDAMLANPGIAAELVGLFEARFAPADAQADSQADAERSGDTDGAADDTAGRSERCDAIVEGIEAMLADVSVLDEDRILRRFVAVILATQRTNFYAPRAGATLALKLHPAEVPGVPEPLPAVEVWVYNPRVEGTHLRFGAVARGGLRWSDRREDFRTEVLGLVKAQMVKNALIVPTGSKGGFYAKRLPDPSERDAWRAEGVAAYRIFIGALLDLTDNRQGDAVIPPEGVVRHDGDDPYLVVAADKGTASFSDIANEVAISYGFWLDDAFASGGSAGYDHKGMGITARGAWVSVQRHFRELGVDVQSQDFTVVGVGDMSGDVFGNGMLRSEHIRLVAAFDHRHVFVDPEPDAASTFAERRRLFELAGSSWDDFDRALISEGGGVFPRSAKSVEVTPQMATALGLDGPASMTPADLVSAVLRAPVDLLWNGGIGTYVKASTETNAEIGDRGNDAVRVDGDQLRCKVVGEGGNLGFSQRGRIEAALNGVLLNTDAIDNAAGVNTSDHEVNIKILLGEVEASGDLTRKQRNELLASMTDDIAAAVLRDNYDQNVLLANAKAQRSGMVGPHLRFMNWLSERGELDRELEFLPSDEVIEERVTRGSALTTPELSVLVAYSKLALKRDLIETSLPDQPWLDRYVAEYFPAALTDRFSDRLASHPLRREIVVNSLANALVNRGGITFVFRAQEETDSSVARIVQAYAIAAEVFDQPSYLAAVEALDNVVSTDTQASLYLAFRRLLDRTVRWWVTNRPASLDIGAEIDRFAGAVAQLGPRISSLLPEGELAEFEAAMQGWVEQGVPEETARSAATLMYLFSCLDIVELAQEAQKGTADGASESARDANDELDAVADVYFAALGRFRVGELLNHVGDLDREDRWAALARASLRDDLYDVLKSITRVVLASTDASQPAEQRVESWAGSHDEILSRLAVMMRSIEGLEDVGLAPVSVAVRSLRGVVRAASVLA